MGLREGVWRSELGRWVCGCDVMASSVDACGLDLGDGRESGRWMEYITECLPRGWKVCVEQRGRDIHPIPPLFSSLISRTDTP